MACGPVGRRRTPGLPARCLGARDRLPQRCDLSPDGRTVYAQEAAAALSAYVSGGDPSEALSGLTAREREVLAGLGQGWSNARLAEELFVSEISESYAIPGIVTGLAVTALGGDIMFIEARIYPGKGEVRLTGQMGDVMKESATAAVSWMRSNATRLGIDPEKIANHDLHIHLPQGAIKKDGEFDFVACSVHNYREFMGGFTDWAQTIADSARAVPA